MGVGGGSATESAAVITEQLRSVLRERDQLSLRASALAAEMARLDFADEVAAVTTVDWIRHEYKLGYHAAADLVRVGLEMESLPGSVAAVDEGTIGFQTPASGSAHQSSHWSGDHPRSTIRRPKWSSLTRPEIRSAAAVTAATALFVRDGYLGTPNSSV